MGKWVAVMLGVLFCAGPAVAHEKRADKCGCHHQYGLRHCHPKYKTKSCEAPVKSTEKPTKKTQSTTDEKTKPQEVRL